MKYLILFMCFMSFNAYSSTLNECTKETNPYAGLTNSVSYAKFNKTPTSDFTISVWIKPFELPTHKSGLVMRGSEGKYFGLLNEDGSFSFYYDDIVLTSPANSVKIGEWNNIAFTFSFGLQNLYIASNLVDTAHFDDYIQKSNTNKPKYRKVNAQIDEAIIFKKSFLTQQEIKAIPHPCFDPSNSSNTPVGDYALIDDYVEYGTIQKVDQKITFPENKFSFVSTEWSDYVFISGISIIKIRLDGVLDLSRVYAATMEIEYSLPDQSSLSMQLIPIERGHNAIGRISTILSGRDGILSIDLEKLSGKIADIKFNAHNLSSTGARLKIKSIKVFGSTLNYINYDEYDISRQTIVYETKDMVFESILLE